MLVKDVTVTLERIAAALSSSEDKATINALLVALNPYSALTLEQLAAALNQDPPRASKAMKPPSAKKPKTPTVDQELAESYVAALQASATDAGAVRRIVAELKANKKAKANEIGLVLSRIRGSDVKVARKADGLKEIEQWYQRRRETERRVGDAGGIY